MGSSKRSRFLEFKDHGTKNYFYFSAPHSVSQPPCPLLNFRADGVKRIGVFLKGIKILEPSCEFVRLQVLEYSEVDSVTMCDLFESREGVWVPVSAITTTISMTHDCVQQKCQDHPWFFLFYFFFLLVCLFSSFVDAPLRVASKQQGHLSRTDSCWDLNCVSSIRNWTTPSAICFCFWMASGLAAPPFFLRTAQTLKWTLNQT